MFKELLDQYVDITTGLLLFQGKKYDPIPYSSVNDELGYQTGCKFSLDTPEGRCGLGGVLAEVNNRTMPQIEAVMGRKGMLSSLAIHKGSNDVGNGYYAYAWQHGLLSSRTKEAKVTFFVQQLKLMHDYCKRVA